MQKRIKIGIILLTVMLLAFLGYKVIAKMQYKNEVAKNIQTLPDFELVTLQGKPFTVKNLTPDSPYVFIYFNSECHYCQNEAIQIQDHIGEFNKPQLLFVSTEGKTKIKDFATQYKLEGYDNVRFLHDPGDTFATVFDVNQIPSIFIYNKKRELVGKYKGLTKVTTILGAIEQ